MQLVLLCLKPEKVMDSTLPFLIQRNICHKILLVGTVAAFKNTLSGCWFLYALRRMINGDVTPIMFKCRLMDL